MRLFLFFVLVLTGCSSSSPYELSCEKLKVAPIYRCSNDEIVCYMSPADNKWNVIRCLEKSK